MSQEHATSLYYGWKIVAAILFTLTFSSGLSFYNHSIYLNALAATPAFTVESASIAVSLSSSAGVLQDFSLPSGFRTMIRATALPAAL